MRSVQVRLVSFIFFLFLVVSIVNVNYEYLTHEDMIIESKIEKGLSVVNGINSGFQKLSDLENKESLFEIINYVKWQNPDIMNIQVNLLRDKLVPYYPSTDVQIDNKNFEVIQTKQMDYKIEENSLTIYAPIIISGNVVGTEEVQISLVYHRVKLKNELVGLFFLYFIFYSIVAIVFLVFVRIILIIPLNKIISGIEKFKQGEYNYSISLNSKDELEDISSSLTVMSKQVIKSNYYFENHFKDLEIEVKKRTSALNTKIDEVQNAKKAIMNILEDSNETNSQLIKTKDELKKKVDELDDVNKKKDEFISVTAHELKTPLTSIKGFTELLKNEQVIKNKEMRENYFNIIIQDTVRLGSLITDILDLTRFDLRTMRFNMEDVKAENLITDVQNLVGLQVKKKRLKFPITSDKKILFNIDRSRIVQVISNLVNNSIKYTEKGEIRLEIFRKEKGKVHFKVTDTGVGIPKDAQSRIFERFYQADSSYTRKVGGSGLGLSICKAIVEFHGGKIWFESRPGKTAFEFTLNEKNSKK